jgi:4-hydroxy-2-oxoheptanedioate aldolase
MRKSNVLRKLRAGEVVSSIKINLADARASEIAALSGADCVWIDQEHIGQNWSVVESNVWATKSHDTDLLVRVSKRGYNDYIKPLELDASDIMVPHVKSEEEAKEIIRMTRFHPVGRRPVDGGNADGAYTALDFNNYLKQANSERFIIFQIEDPEALDELGAIAALDGFDMLFFGPGDFSQGIGAPGEWNHPDIAKARRRIAKVAEEYGKFAGTVGSPNNLQELISMGYQFVNVGGDMVGLKNHFKRLLRSFRSI